MKIVLFSVGAAVVVAVAARVLIFLIGLITNLAFYGLISGEMTTPWVNHLVLWVIIVPVIGSLIVGMMARYGSKAIRGHGIPEAMEQVLTNESRIPRRMTLLKPLSAAIVIGTGGPFGAEGPIIATGAALGSWLGQIVHVSAPVLHSGCGRGLGCHCHEPVSVRRRTAIPCCYIGPRNADGAAWLSG